MHVTHELLERATPICIPFRSPWGSISVAKAEVGGKMKYFIWKTNFRKRFDWDGSFFDIEGEMLRITLNMLHDAGYLSFPDYWKPEDEDNGQPPAWFALKADADRHRAEIAAQARQQTAKTAIYTFSEPSAPESCDTLHRAGRRTMRTVKRKLPSCDLGSISRKSK